MLAGVFARRQRIAAAAALLGALAACALLGCSGNGMMLERSYPYRVQVFFRPEVPNAFVSLKTPPAVGEHGTMIGYIHGWPFAHGEPEGVAPPSLFSYVIDFTVTGTGGAEVAARGTRTIYFNPGGAPTSFNDPRAFIAGKPVITESAALSLAFDTNYQRATVDLRTRQLASHPFVYQGKLVTPPGTAERSDSLTGNYAGTYGGYLMHQPGAPSVRPGTGQLAMAGALPPDRSR